MSPATRPARAAVLTGHAESPAADPAVAHELAGDDLGRIDPDRKADPLGREDHRGVHPDHAAATVHQGPARIARVQGGVGLDHIIDETPRDLAERTTQGAHDTGGHGTLEPERVTDRHDELA